MTEHYQLTSEQNILKETVGRMAQEKIGPYAAEIDETGEFPWDVHEQLKELGLFGLVIPEDYGGSDAGMLSAVLALEEIGRVCSSSAIICAAPIVVGRIILESGNDEQKRKYLPQIASGETIPAFALTESEADSDLARLTTKADREEYRYIINGRKCFIPLADVAGLMTVFARTGQGSAMDAVSVFVVERNNPGWSVSRIERKMGTQAIHDCELIFERCVIPEVNRLGKEGEGFIIAMRSQEVSCILTAARTIGLAQGAFDYALGYTQERIQFGRSISSFQGIQFMLAEMAMQIEAGRYLLYKAGAEMDSGADEGFLYGSMAKCFVTDMAMKLTTDAVQLLGGYGYMKDHPLERMMRDAKLTQVVEGTNQSRRLMVGREILKRYPKTV
jgi:alkylation response protein AidB-like acyl-CoA dehydrogenase